MKARFRPNHPGHEEQAEDPKQAIAHQVIEDIQENVLAANLFVFKTSSNRDSA
ncbi:Hypothetical protein PMT_2833 [Prochlorococcus marinus str. MIT 9313]|uniref:Uncharacterized protein n=1 Tax=Prochlorococcus marinus (strain MIT 9313) TaxID=74547 RepID=B9ESK5_PROMM|nr:Hypothetical protein PMT_2833 [Prochlorococcus marinus str. MIT 9313]